jgi:phosphoglycerate dehydrogenase-like enzyme
VSAKFRIAVTGDYERLALRAVPWTSLGDDVEVVAFHEPFNAVRRTVEALRDFDAVTLMHERVALTREVIEQLPRLKIIVFNGRKNAELDDQAAAARNILVCRSNPNFEIPAGEPGGKSPSELTLALLLSCAWRTGPLTTLIRTGGWASRAGLALRGKVLGILGYGSVGKPVARMASALGMHVLVFSRSLTVEAARAANVTRADLDTVLKNSDVISLHLPLNASTRRLIGKEQIAQMKDGVILINTARAAIVDEGPFIDALRWRKIAMAGLDVFWQEPLPEDHPLMDIPNLVMTPHIGYATAETMVVRYQGQLETLLGYRQGRIIGRYSSHAVA